MKGGFLLPAVTSTNYHLEFRVQLTYLALGKYTYFVCFFFLYNEDMAGFFIPKCFESTNKAFSADVVVRVIARWPRKQLLTLPPGEQPTVFVNSRSRNQTSVAQ